MSPEYAFAFLIGAAFLAGYMDAIAGGGGMVTIPALLIAGVDPLAALGTNKAQGIFGTASSSIAFISKGHVQLRPLLPAMALVFAGAVAGAVGVQFVPVAWLTGALPFVLIAIALYFALKPGIGDVDRVRRVSPALMALLVLPAIGAYDGLFGPGTGSFFMLAFVALAGYGVLKATAHTKLLNLSSNLGGFAVFAAVGVIEWRYALPMALAQIVGGQLGARSAMSFGVKLIKPLLVTVSIALAIRLLWTA